MIRRRVESVEKMEQLMPLLRECLAAGQSIRFFPRGVSMMPMLREGIDSVVLSPVPERLKKYDLPLYQRENGQYILHRVISVGENYTCMGDHQFVPETGIHQSQMLGVVTEFYRGDKKHDVQEPGYRIYCRLWYHTRRVRRFVLRGVNWIRRHLG